MKQSLAAISLMTVVLTIACGGNTPVQPSSLNVASSSAAGGARATLSSSRHSEQLVFSGDADANSTFQNGSGVEFWIWCEADSTNPYVGECNGAMRFDELGIVRHVEDASVTETGEGIYTIRVVSSTDGAVDCTLSNTAEPAHGPSNTVQVSCTTPAGSATATSAVVNVTGPSGS